MIKRASLGYVAYLNHEVHQLRFLLLSLKHAVFNTAAKSEEAETGQLCKFIIFCLI